MELTFLTTPTGLAVIAAGGSFLAGVVGNLVGAGISSWTVRSTHRQRLLADEKLAERKFEFDKDLAERKFKHDRDLQGEKRRTDLAEVILAEFLQTRDVIRDIRSPSVYFGRLLERPKKNNETDEEARQKEPYHVILDRIKNNSEFISSLFSKRYQCRAVPGNDIDKAFELVEQALRKVRISADALIHSFSQPERIRAKNEANIRSYEEDIWEGYAEADRLQPMLDKAVKIVDEICRPILERSPTL